MELKGVTQTSGHLASNGGLRGHSVGDFFPVILAMVGKFDNLKHLVTAPDGASHIVNNREEAEQLAQAWLETRKHTDGLPAIKFVRDKVKANTDSQGETNCEEVGIGSHDFDFYSVYAYCEDGFAGAVWDSKGKGVEDLLFSLVVIEFLEKRGPKS